LRKFKNLNTLLKILKNENVKGANYILYTALHGLIDLVLNYRDDDILDYIKMCCEKIFKTQPTMAILANSLALILLEINNISIINDLHRLKNQLVDRIQYIINEIKLSIQKICEHSTNIFRNKKNILTYSFSSTIYKILQYQKQLNHDFTLYITESRPMNEGINGAIELSRLFNVKLFIDAAIGYIIKEYNIDLIIVGADSFTENELINKIGTCPLAITAHEFEIPIYVLTSSYKYYFGHIFKIPIKINQKPSYEITKKKLRNIDIINYYFDKTPIKYISGIITENGIHDLKKDQLDFKEKFPIKIIQSLYMTI